MLRSYARLLCALVVAWALPAWAQEGPLPEGCAGLRAGPSRSVARVIDGETVALDDGSELRLVGMLAPRAGDVEASPGQWPIEIAAQEELRALLLGKSIEIAFGGTARDRYGRVLAHAFVRDGTERRWVQGHMLGQGLARAYTQAGNRACRAELLAAERPAREERRGLWVEAAYRVRRARDTIELMRRLATFQVVEGRIARAALARDTVYLDLSAMGRRGFGVSLRREDGTIAGVSMSDLAVLEGRAVRVRGWLERRRGRSGGPAMALSVAGDIEILGLEDAADGNDRASDPLASRQR